MSTTVGTMGSKRLFPVFACTPSDHAFFMKRRIFLFTMAWFHMIAGAIFFFVNERVTVMLLRDPGPTSPLLVKGLSGIVFAFGLMNFLVRNSTDKNAFRPVMIGTTCYLLFTVLCDVNWIVSGLLYPLAWWSIVIRSVFALGYIHLLSRANSRKG